MAIPLAGTPGLELKQPMGDPELQTLWGEAQPLAGAEAVGQLHRHMASQLAAATLQHQGQPGVKGIRPQAPEPQLRNLGALPRIALLQGPIELKFQHRSKGQQLRRPQRRPGGQRSQIKAADHHGIELDQGGGASGKVRGSTARADLRGLGRGWRSSHQEL